MAYDDIGLPFPGMNPYLEARRLWPEVHNKLISEIHYFLREDLPPQYTVTMEERVIVEESFGDVARQRYAVPDVNIAGDALPLAGDAVPATDAGSVSVLLPETYPVREWYIEIRTQSRLPSVAILEVLSHSNKRAGPGRRAYIEKRQRILDSATHLVEIDLLRANNPMSIVGYDGDAPYRILVSDGRVRPHAALYPFDMQSAIPSFVVPLLGQDEGPTIKLGEICNDIYLRGHYERYADYNDDPEGPLSADDRVWLDQMLREKGLRR